MYSILITFHVIVCICIIIVVLLQVGRGAELGAAFGSVGQANNQRGEATFVGKFTTTMAILFMITSFLLTYVTADKAKTSVIDKVSIEETQSTAPKAADETKEVAPTPAAPAAPVEQPEAPKE